MRRTPLPELTYRQGWWLLAAGVAALVAERGSSGLLALALFLVGMVLLSVAAVTFLRIVDRMGDESDV